MVVDGKKIALGIRERLKKGFAEFSESLTMAIVCVGNDPVSQKYINKKKELASELGVQTMVFRYDKNITQGELEQAVKDISADSDYGGIVVQLPLPEGIDSQAVLELIVPEKDIDALSLNPLVFPPTVGAIREILEYYNVDLGGKDILVIGRGKLVGKPTTDWLRKEGYKFEVVDEFTKDVISYTSKADIIISGAGSPRLIKPDMIKDGVVIIDAGTSEDKGKLVGDADPLCAEKCSLISPVTGGVGPLTVVLIFKNLLDLNISKIK